MVDVVVFVDVVVGGVVVVDVVVVVVDDVGVFVVIFTIPVQCAGVF